MARSYAYRKRSLILFARVLDKIGFFFHKPKARATLDPRRILIVRLDQLGDIVMALPVFSSLKKSFPNAELHALTTTAGGELLREAGVVDDCLIWDCPWFDQSRNSRTSILEMRRTIRKGRYDCVLELRGDLRLIALLRCSGVRNLVGYNATGGGFLLDVGPEWDPNLHAIDKNIKLVEAIGGFAASRRPSLRAGAGTRKKGFRLAIHPGAGTAAKRWPVGKFVEVINRLSSDARLNIELIGSDQVVGKTLDRLLQGPVSNQIGKTTLLELIDCLRSADGLLTNDSGPAHLAAALDKPVWILWSGTAASRIWAPRGDKVVLFEHEVSCSPCALPNCPVEGHPCLTKIEVESVLRSIQAHVETSL